MQIGSVQAQPTKSVDGPTGLISEGLADSVSAKTQDVNTVRTSTGELSAFLPAGASPGGGGGEAGAPNGRTNRDFLDEVFRVLPGGAVAVVCSKSGDPAMGGWPAKRADTAVGSADAGLNNFFNCSSFYPAQDGSVKARKESFAACHVLLFDDIGTKVPWSKVGDFEFSWLIETSPANYQAGVIFTEPLTNLEEAEQLLNAVISAGYCDPGAGGPGSRWARLPAGVNGKPKHRDASGKVFQCRLAEFHPERQYTPHQVVQGLGLNLSQKKSSVAASSSPSTKAAKVLERSSGIYTPKAAENPVIAALKKEGLYKRALGHGKHDITCPWVIEHTDAADNGTAYFEPSGDFPTGGFKCQHSHGPELKIGRLIDRLGLTQAQARNKPLINVVPGELDRVVDIAERVLAGSGNFYQAGGLIVSLAKDPATGDARIVPTRLASLAMELSAAADWEKFDARSGRLVPCDPPVRHLAMLCELQNYEHLLPLSGLARQPYFRETGGALVKTAGYDTQSQLIGVFNPAEFQFPEPTLEAAQQALGLLDDLLVGFHFESSTDKAAAMSAMFTAVLRPTLANAPGFHVRAPTIGSGKSYLCDLIGAFAGPGPNRKVTYPRTSDEATKMMMSLLIENVPVVDFDDMEGDWYAHGIIKRIFTADKVSDRLLGGNKSPTVSTRTTFLGSSNNGGPVQDLLRRVLTIRLDPQTATPAMLEYASKPLDKVRQDRGKYVVAVLTIVQAWRAAGSPRNGANIASYGGAWSDYCRYPLIWLGQPDPVAKLFEQITHDPELDDLGVFMDEWQRAFQARATTVRKAVEVMATNTTLFDALCEFPGVVEGEKVNRNKFGRFLRRNENRIVRGRKFRKTRSDGRTGWELVPVAVRTALTLPSAPPLPLTPPAAGLDSETSVLDPVDIEF